MLNLTFAQPSNHDTFLTFFVFECNRKFENKMSQSKIKNFQSGTSDLTWKGSKPEAFICSPAPLPSCTLHQGQQMFTPYYANMPKLTEWPLKSGSFTGSHPILIFSC